MEDEAVENPPDLAAGRTAGDQEEPMVAKCMAAWDKKYGALMSHLSKKYAAEMAAPSATNVAIPGVPPEKEKEKEKEKEPERMQRKEDDVMRYALLERENKELKAAVQTLSGKVDEVMGSYQKKDRNYRLKELRGMGYQFDLDDELKYCEAMTNEQFGAHLARIPKLYQKDPTGAFIPVSEREAEMEGPGGGNSRDLSSRQFEDCMQYMREHPEADFDEVLEKVKAKGKKAGAA
jgi:hypothetical protein